MVFIKGLMINISPLMFTKFETGWGILRYAVGTSNRS